MDNDPQHSGDRKMSKTGNSGSVTVGLHGLGEILRAIHSAPQNLQQKFETHMGTDNLTVTLDKETAGKIKEFVTANFADEHPLFARLNRDNCDPATDPWCINTHFTA
jgi:hypothetical protein